MPAALYPDLAGKAAFVTGGSKGIGAATCRLLAENGVKVAVVARGVEAARSPCQRSSAPAAPKRWRSPPTVPTPEQVEAARREAEDRLGPVDLLVPFAGGFEYFTPVAEMTVDEWREVVEANLTSTFVTVRAFLPGMIERRQRLDRDHVVDLGALPRQADPGRVRGGEGRRDHVHRHLAIEVGPYGIRANCVAPGTTMSERIERVMSPEAIEYTTGLSPLRPHRAPRRTPHTPRCSCSPDAASWLTGVTIDVNGGRVML